MLSQYMSYFHALFKSREIRTLRTGMAIVFPLPTMDVEALASGLNGHWVLKSQEGADM